MGDADDEADEVLGLLEQEVRGVPPRKVVVLCIGNTARGDDGFGPATAEGLRASLGAHVFEGGAVPENDLPGIAALDPDVVIMVDAVHFGGRPGEQRLLRPDELRQDDVSTHTGSLSVLAQFLEGACKARVLVLAAQPGSTCLGEGLSEDMKQAVGETCCVLQRALGTRPDEREAL